MIAVAIGIASKHVACVSNSNEFDVCQAPHFLAGIIVTMVAIAVCFLEDVWNSICLVSSIKRPQSLMLNFVILATIVHAASLCSSSFVEEEHQLWYFFGRSFLFALAIADWHCRRAAANRLRVPGMGADLASRNADEYMTCVERWFYRNGEGLSWMIVLAAHVGLSHLNRTGDKWLSVPDVGDWLVVEENLRWHSIFVGGGKI